MTLLRASHDQINSETRTPTYSNKKTMKAIMISFDQAHYENVLAVLDRSNARGFTMMEQTQGRGSKSGEPHYGSHAWPSMCSTVITIVEDQQVDPILKRLHELDLDSQMLGLRAFVWNVEQTI